MAAVACAATEAYMTEVLTRAALVAAGLGLLLPALAAARACRCNIKRARAAFAAAPLAHVTPAALTAQSPRGLPARWPEPSSLSSDLRAAYARLARDRADNRMLVGELILIVSGAAAGATITAAFRSTGNTWGLALSLLLGAVGIMLRNFVAQYWTEVAALYER